jgi:asparagine synthase (glutamine-hydrolysing)
MCGFVGFINNKNFSSQTLDEMISSIKHRGPDGIGTFHSDKIQLGHVRLSLVDLENGKQPMFFNDLVIVFNGEIYNHKELRKLLVLKGYHFLTFSDTEVVVKLFDYYKYDFVKYLNGIYSIVIFNRQTNELILARDFFGIKPLYIYKHDDVFAFSSEIKGLFKFFSLNDISYTFNNSALEEYLLKGYISENELIKGCYSLKSGTVFSLSNFQLVEKYTIVVLPKKTSTSLIKQTLESQVLQEMEADVEIGILLSGGIDSSLITALSAKSNRPIKTFSIGYKESSIYDESIYARIVSKKFGTLHKEYLFTERDLIDELNSLISCMDQPIYDPAMLPMLFLTKNVKMDVKAVLSGDGGDELFGGYVQYRLFRFRLFFKVFLAVEYFLKKWVKKISLIRPLLYNIGYSYGPFFNSSFLLENKGLRPKKSFSNVKELMKHDVENELKYKLLVKTDLTSMFNGLEIRVPFLNLNLYEQSLSLSSSKLVNLFKGKLELRKILSNYLNSDIVDKKKVGFRVPIREWICDGDLGNLVEDDLMNNLFIPNQVISLQSIQFLLSKRKDGIYGDELFSLYLLNQWLIKNSYNENITNKRIV